MGDLVQSVKRALAIQELRQAGYKKLKKAQDEYSTHNISLDEYQKSMADVTASFQSLSQEMMGLSKLFREHTLPASADVLDRIQVREKEKLQLTAQWQVMQAEAQEESEDEECFGETAHKQKTMRQRLAAVEGAIAELVQDFRYECEPILLAETTDATTQVNMNS